jgi:hypothetical protein
MDARPVTGFQYAFSGIVPNVPNVVFMFWVRKEGRVVTL